MRIPGFEWRRAGRWVALPVLALLGAAALASTACNTYYIPPPPVSIFVASPVSSLVITTTDSNGVTGPSTVQLDGTVSNSTNTNIIYSVGVYGNYVQGGDNVYGTVSSTGVYTAPAVVPTPNTVTIQAQAQADPTQASTTSITLLNPAASIASVTPAVVTAGGSYTLQLTGANFEPGATVNLQGAQLQAPNIVSSTEITVGAQIASSGLLSLNVVNPSASAAAGSFALPSQPTSPSGSGAVAVEIATARTSSIGQPTLAAQAFIPKGNTVAVVDLDTNKEIASVAMPTGFTATEAAADPAHNRVVVAGAGSNMLQLVDANNDLVTGSIATPATSSTTVDGATCQICSLMVDSTRDEAILDTAGGYLTVDLATGVASAPLAGPAAANFGYDPTTQRVFVPYHDGSGSGVDVLDLVSDTVTTVLPGGGAIYGTGPDTAAFDAATALLTVGDNNGGAYLNLNFNGALSGAGTITAPSSAFSITSACPGVWNDVNVDAGSRTGWFANQGSCIAMAAMPTSPASGTPGGPTTIRWAVVPLGPDGLAWENTPIGQPQSVAVYGGTDGHVYGLAVNQSDTELLKVDLTLLGTATAVSGSTDANQVDPTQATSNGATVSTLTFIPLR